MKPLVPRYGKLSRLPFGSPSRSYISIADATLIGSITNPEAVTEILWLAAVLDSGSLNSSSKCSIRNQTEGGNSLGLGWLSILLAFVIVTLLLRSCEY